MPLQRPGGRFVDKCLVKPVEESRTTAQVQELKRRLDLEIERQHLGHVLRKRGRHLVCQILVPRGTQSSEYARVFHIFDLAREYAHP